MLPRVIGLTGKKGSGKSTAAKILVEDFDYTVVKFAAVIKDMARAFGLTEREIEGDLKEAPRDILCGKSPRQFQQWLGTEFGRNLLGPDVWVNAWEDRVIKTEGRIVADDCRFQNEVAAIHRRIGLVIRINPHNLLLSSSEHASELLEIDDPDYTIVNDFNLGNLRNSLHRILE